MNLVTNLFPQIYDRKNLGKALWRAARGKRDRPEVVDFLLDGDQRINELTSDLKMRKYKFQRYRSFAVRDTKTRIIRAPTFQDRVVHHAIINVLGPILERSAIAHSYACRLGRGQHAALQQAKTWTRRASWYGKLDFRRYYDSVDHELLKARLIRIFKEPEICSLFETLIDSWESCPGKGLPIGALTSQYLGNFYLDAFDAQMKGTGLCHRYVRYMDDIVIWSFPEQLPGIRESAKQAAESLRLEIKNGGEWNQCKFGVPFLGFVIYPDRIRLGRLARRRLRRKYRLLRRQFRDGLIDEGQFQSRASSLFAHARSADDGIWRKSLLNCQASVEGQQ